MAEVKYPLGAMESMSPSDRRRIMEYNVATGEEKEVDHNYATEEESKAGNSKAKLVNPTILFGKHKGISLSELPVDYLAWMASEGRRNSVIWSGRNWTDLARGELARRSVDGDLSGINFDDLEDLENIKNVSKFMVEWDAVNEASKLLLKEFIIRSDKEKGIYTWLRALTEEMFNLGFFTQTKGELPADNIFLEADYIGHKFLCRLGKTRTGIGTLCLIKII